jgi:uncharacterized membrane protein YgcG
MRKVLWLFALLFMTVSVSAQEPHHILNPKIDSLFPESSNGFLTDVTNSVPNEGPVIVRLSSIAHTQKVHIVAVTLPTIKDYLPAEVATEIGRKWRVATKNDTLGAVTRNAGAVILLVMDKHQCFIATAIGTERYLTDATAADLCRDARPHFRTGDFGAGIISIANGIAAKAQQEASVAATVRPTKASSTPTDETSYTWLWWALVIIGTIGGVIGFIFWIDGRVKKINEWWKNKIEEEKRKMAEEYSDKRDRANAAIQTLQAQLATTTRLLTEEKEARRWEKLTPLEQAAELTEKERLRQQALVAERRAAAARAKEEKARLAREAVEAENRRKRQQEEEEERQRNRSSSYNSYSSTDYGSSSGGSSYDSGGSSSGGSDSFGGGGGGDSW